MIFRKRRPHDPILRHLGLTPAAAETPEGKRILVEHLQYWLSACGHVPWELWERLEGVTRGALVIAASGSQQPEPERGFDAMLDKASQRALDEAMGKGA